MDRDIETVIAILKRTYPSILFNSCRSRTLAPMTMGYCSFDIRR